MENNEAKEVVKYVDGETGDIYESPEEMHKVIEERKRQKAEDKNVHFVQLMQGVAPNLLKDISKSGLHILGYFLDNLDMQDCNTIMVSQNVIAKELNVTRQTVANGIKSLVELKIIAVGKIGQSNIYLINPNVVWMNGYRQRETMRLRATAILGKEENEKIFAEFDKVERHSLKQINSPRVKIQSNYNYGEK